MYSTSQSWKMMEVKKLIIMLHLFLYYSPAPITLMALCRMQYRVPRLIFRIHDRWLPSHPQFPTLSSLILLYDLTTQSYLSVLQVNLASEHLFMPTLMPGIFFMTSITYLICNSSPNALNRWDFLLFWVPVILRLIFKNI